MRKFTVKVPFGFRAEYEVQGQIFGESPRWNEPDEPIEIEVYRIIGINGADCCRCFGEDWPEFEGKVIDAVRQDMIDAAIYQAEMNYERMKDDAIDYLGVGA